MEAPGRRRPRLDAGARLAQRAPARTIRSPTSRPCSSAADPVDAPEIGEFWSGAVGYFGYDVARLIERLPDPARARRRRARCAVRLHRRPRHLRQPALAGARRRRRAGRSERVGRRSCARPTSARCAPSNATVERLRGPAVLGPLDLDPSAPPAEGQSRYDKDKFLADVERVRAVHHCRRRVPGADRPAHRRAVRFFVDGPLSRAARDQSVAVHVPPRPRRRRDRRQLAGAPHPRQRERNRDAAPDRRHAPARTDRRGRRAR